MPALLADRRQWGVHRGDVVRSEASVQLAAHIASVGGGSLGAKAAAQRRCEAEGSKRRLLFARRAETATVTKAGREGHVQLEIHCIAVSIFVPRISSVGLRAVREGCCSCAMRACLRRADSAHNSVAMCRQGRDIHSQVTRTRTQARCPRWPLLCGRDRGMSSTSRSRW